MKATNKKNTPFLSRASTVKATSYFDKIKSKTFLLERHKFKKIENDIANMKNSIYNEKKLHRIINFESPFHLVLTIYDLNFKFYTLLIQQ